MIRILPTQQYSDCSPQDFTHYFCKSFMVLRLTDMKDRIYLPEQVDGHIVGSYLTRSKEWKPLNLKWEDWWKRLSLIAPFPVSFNLPTAACLWQPNIAKNGLNNATGYRKSFPNIVSTNILRIFGKKVAEEITNQSLVFNAFGMVYKNKESFQFPTLGEEPRLRRAATACEGDFLVDRTINRVFYKGTLVGRVGVEDKILLHHPHHNLIDLMIVHGAKPNQVELG